MKVGEHLTALPPRVCLFGISTLPPFFVDVLDALALCKFGEAYREFEAGGAKPPDHKWLKDVQWDTMSMDGTGKRRAQRLAVDDSETFRICKGGE